jgi:nucleoside-diphosphate-sugar epimerase
LSIRVLVTGYGGFLGAAICRSLVARGYLVRGVARGDYPELQRLGVEVIRGSVTDPDVCDRAVRGTDAIIHTAALAGVWGPKRAYEQTNVEATDALIDASRRHNLRAFVFTSSPSVTFDGSPQSGIDESVPYPTKWMCDYPRTKAISEQRVLEANDSGTMSTCALRPHLIWGVGDPHLIPRVIERCRTGRLRCVGDGSNLIDTVHVENAALAHCLALERLLEHDSRASGRAYFITDGEPQGCWDWIRTILECAGLRAPDRRISLQRAARIGAALEVVYSLLRISAEPPMTRFVAAQLGVDHYFKIDSARERLSYQPEANRAARVAQLKAWLSNPSA